MVLREANESDALREEIAQLFAVIKVLVNRAGGQVSIPRHELESAPEHITSFVTPDKRTVMLSTWDDTGG